MTPKKKPRRPAPESRHLQEFEGVRSKPANQRGSRRTPPSDPASPSLSRAQTPAPDTSARGRKEPGPGSGNPAGERSSSGRPTDEASTRSTEAWPLVDPRSDPEVMFRLLSDRIAVKVDRAAMKAGASAAHEVGRRLTAELDAAIAGAQSTAGKMGTLVQQAVQAAVDEALRTAVLNATRVHEEHLAQLALIDRTAQTAHDIAAVRLRVEEEMRRSGISRVTTANPDAFNLVNPAENAGSESFEVLAPAYVDSRTGRIIQRGEMRRLPAKLAAPVTNQGSDR